MGKAAKEKPSQESVVKKRKHRAVRLQRLQYSKEDVSRALQEVMKGQSYAAASRKYKIPESTLRAKQCNRYPERTALGIEKEEELVNWIFRCYKAGFPVTKHQLLLSVQVMCKNSTKKNPFTDGIPGRNWYEGFLRRHPEISTKVAENICLNRAKVWYSETFAYLSTEHLLNIEPERVFNTVETGVPLNPTPPEVLAPDESIDASSKLETIEKETISVLLTGNAAGDLVPCLILFAGNSLPTNVAEMAPNDFSIGYSDVGWLTAEAFYEYMVNVFDPWITIKHIPRPVILYVDSRSAHLTFHLSEFCSERGIILIALHPDITHIIQPLEVMFFRNFKAKWQKIHNIICDGYPNIGIKKYQFAPILKRTFECMDIKNPIISGFKKCGLYPFDTSAIDYSKVFRRNLTPLDSERIVDDAESIRNRSESLKVVESLLSENKLQAFRSNGGPVWRGLKKDESLFETWYRLSHPAPVKKQPIVEPADEVEIECEIKVEIKEEIMDENLEESF